MKWIECGDKKPYPHWEYVLVTDGELVCLATWISEPEKWYEGSLEEGLIDEEGKKLDKEWHDPHWLFHAELAPLIDGKECFGQIGDITHWMPIPKPKKIKSSLECEF